jgi:hypothetical protein
MSLNLFEGFYLSERVTGGGYMSAEPEIRKLLEIRGELEAKVERLKVELDDMRKVMAEIDKAIVKQGFRQPTPEPEQVKPQEDGGSSIQAKDGTVLGRLAIDADTIVFTPREELGFLTSIPPFQSFLVDRVLANMRSTDEDRATRGEIDSKDILSYDVQAEGETIHSLVVHNYGGERRLREIQSSLRWSFDKMYDKLRRG